MKKFILISLMSLIWTNAEAETDYLGIDTSNHTIYGITVAGISLDWLTTLQIERNYDKGYYETNRWLGRYPKRSRINLFFLAKLVFYTCLNYFDLFKNVKNIFNLEESYISWSAVNNNIRAGLKVKF